MQRLAAALITFTMTVGLAWAADDSRKSEKSPSAQASGKGNARFRADLEACKQKSNGEERSACVKETYAARAEGLYRDDADATSTRVRSKLSANQLRSYEPGRN
jgi:hypothetical protein